MDHPGRAPGKRAQLNDFTRTTPAGFPEGPVTTTPDTIYFAFGFEGITDAADRNEVMGRAMRHLLSPTQAGEGTSGTGPRYSRGPVRIWRGCEVRQR